MNKAERLLQILTVLSARHFAVRAEDLADMFNISKRTIYRDISSLRIAGAEIEGEAGTGYALRRGAQLPPLNFSEEELSAIVFGIQLVQRDGDFALATAAGLARSKILAVVSENGRRFSERLPFAAPNLGLMREEKMRLGALRLAVLTFQKLRIHYRAKSGAQSERVVWPLGLIAWGDVWTLLAWCELRQDYRSFRVDLMENLHPLKEEFPQISGRTLQDYLKNSCHQARPNHADFDENG